MFLTSKYFLGSPYPIIVFATVLSVYLMGLKAAHLQTKWARDYGTYTRMLMAAVGVTWKEHKNKQTDLYGNLNSITEMLRTRRQKSIGYMCMRKGELASKVFLWVSKQGKKKMDTSDDRHWPVEERHRIINGRTDSPGGSHFPSWKELRSNSISFNLHL